MSNPADVLARVNQKICDAQAAAANLLRSFSDHRKALFALTEGVEMARDSLKGTPAATQLDAALAGAHERARVILGP